MRSNLIEIIADMNGNFYDLRDEMLFEIIAGLFDDCSFGFMSN